MPKISVIMSVYMEPIDWIRQAIDSILGQTYKDFEFIIVNDRPDRKENSLFLEECQKRDNRIIILTNETNIGLTKSLNRALDIAAGEYIARMDADDISLPHRFATQVVYLDSHPDVCGCGSWTGNIDENGERFGDITKYETDVHWIRAQFLQNSQVAHPSAMFRRVVKGHISRYNEEVRYAQDYSLWVSLLPYGEISNIPDVLFCYRKSEQQVTNSKTLEQQECARVAQRKAFQDFNFSVTDSFLNIFFSLTILHKMDLPMAQVVNEFKNFYKNVKMTRGNRLALEIIYSTYLAYLQHISDASRMKFACWICSKSSFFMHYIGVCLVQDLIRRKLSR